MMSTTVSLSNVAVDTITALMRPRLAMTCAEPVDLMPDWPAIEPWPAVADGDGVPRLLARAAAGARALYLRFECPVVDNRLLMPRGPAHLNSEYDRVWFDLHPHNDPAHRFHFEIDYRGIHSVASHRRITGERSLENVPDVWQKTDAASIDSDAWTRYYGVEADHWWCQLELPWRALGLDRRPPTLGLAYGRSYRASVEAPYLTSAAWPSGERLSTCPAALEPGEALLGPWADAPQQIELANLRFGSNKARLVMPSDWPRRAATVSLQVLRPHGEAQPAQAIAVQAGDKVSLPFTLDRCDSSHVDQFQCTRLQLTVQDQASGEMIYRAKLPIDRHLGLCVDEAYGEAPVRAVDGDAREQWLQRVVRALPRLHRATTRQGAPSDFCLLFEDGSVAANLMLDNPWPALVAIIEQRFASAEDRLVAAMALIGQKSVTNLILGPMFFEPNWKHHYHSTMHEMMGPMSIIRYGGGPPAERAVALAELLRHLTNPLTGKPFSARPIFLDAGGGPRQMAYNRNAGKVLSFAQQPGSIGAAAVQLRGQWTLLDPTSLAFFPVDGQRLASLEQIVTDAAVRQCGAGRLADIYAKLDVEEALRHRPDPQLSKGVFPELCHDEIGPDRPFDPRERQDLGDRVLVAPLGRSAVAAGFSDIYGRSGARNGSVTVCPTAEHLAVRVAVAIDARAFNDRDRAAECVNLAIDGQHNHVEFHTFSAWLNGDRRLAQAQSNQIQTLFKHGATHAYTEKREIKDAAWSASFSEESAGYSVEFRVPWQTLDLQADKLPTALGLNIWVDGRYPHYEQVFASSPRWMRAADAFSFMDLYLVDTPLTLQAIDFDVPKWGMNWARLRLRSSAGKACRATVCVSNILGMSPKVRRLDPVTVQVPANGEIEAKLPYFVDPSEKMSGPQQRLVLEIAADDAPIYRGQWHIGYCGPLSTYYRYGSQFNDVPPGLPAHDDPIIEQKVRSICAKLPVFRRMTTRDGAASDFVVRAEDGSIEFNLMSDGVLDQMARYIEQRFDNDLDRVLGMLFFNHAPWIARHMSSGHRFMEGAGPLSVVRGHFAGGGGNCGYHSRCFAGMASHLRFNGQRLVAHTLGVWGHSIAAIAWRGSKVLFDPDVGHFFLNAQGNDMATLEEMRSVRGVHSTAGPGEMARYRTAADAGILAQRSIENLRFHGVFPPGGSAE